MNSRAWKRLGALARVRWPHLVCACCVGLVSTFTAPARAQVGPNGQLLVTVQDPPLGLTCEDTIDINVTTAELIAQFGGSASVPAGSASDTGQFLRGAIDVDLNSPVPVVAAGDFVTTRSGLGYCRVDWDIGLNGFFQILFASFRQLEITVSMNGNGRLGGDRGSSIDVTQVRFRDPDAGAAYGTTYTPVPFDHWTGGTLPIELEFEVEFDLSNASSAGLHDRNRPVFTITLDYL